MMRSVRCVANCLCVDVLLLLLLRHVMEQQRVVVGVSSHRTSLVRLRLLPQLLQPQEAALLVGLAVLALLPQLQQRLLCQQARRRWSCDLSSCCCPCCCWSCVLDTASKLSHVCRCAGCVLQPHCCTALLSSQAAAARRQAPDVDRAA